MIAGPWRAPSSPPDTPMPRKRRPFGTRRACRRLGVAPHGVAGIDDGVARPQQRLEMRQRLVKRPAPALTISRIERGGSSAASSSSGVRHGTSRSASGPASFSRLIDTFRRAVVHRHPEPLLGHIEREIAPHDGEAHHADICLRHDHPSVKAERPGGVRARPKVRRGDVSRAPPHWLVQRWTRALPFQMLQIWSSSAGCT